MNFVGGVGVSAGYLGRDELTANAFFNYDGYKYYRTGDLVRLGSNGLLYYQGRKDHQVKLHGQRIELGEIERCLLQTSVTACVVIKWGDDHLVAYVQSSTIDEKLLRDHCQSHLPSHMIPSMFIVLDKLPLNANGKVDRKLLPAPNFSQLSSKYLKHDVQILAPNSEVEIIIHKIWCDIFHQNQISIDTDIFTIGGHSLLLMQINQLYKAAFHLEKKTFSIADLFGHPTIVGHARLIDQAATRTIMLSDQWTSLKLIQARASFAQERIILDEQIRFSSKDDNNMYIIPLLYRISSSTTNISIVRLQQALQAVIIKHSILRTAFYLDTNGTIMQHCLDAQVIFDKMISNNVSLLNVYDVDNDIRSITVKINEILNNSDLFDLSKGRVISCHILRQYHAYDDRSFGNDDRLTKNDFILFSIHHSVFDGTSVSTFLRDLYLAYDNNANLPIDENMLQYVDYSVYERLIDMTSSREFWHSQFQGYNIQRPLSWSFDRHRSSIGQRSGLASIVCISFNKEVASSFLNYASSHQVTPFQLGLATFYIFLFKLTHGQTDLCVTSVNANRYRSELQNLIGMFVSTLPCRLQLDSHWSFGEVVKHVREKCLSILEHSQYPLQQMLADFHLNQSNVPFLETIFDFITLSSNTSLISFDGATVEQESVEEFFEVARFDFLMRFIYDPTSGNDELSCSLVCSRDLFDQTTIKQMVRRFQNLFEEIFAVNFNITSIEKFCIILPEEAEEMQTTVFSRLENNVNEGT
ncbi:hypothetical protein I4U23_005469 [Adineta vaga]|nr:hypothetical protein I4U23_005469 [Adineta vaga]